jgi:hypothetical protein
MRASFRFLVAAIFFMLSPGCLPAAGASSTGAADHLDRILLQEILRAGGKTDEQSLDRYEASLRRAVEEIEKRVGGNHSPYRTARRVHAALHQRFLRRYDASADGMDAILDRSEYNCVSASLLYGIVVRAFGIPAEVLEVPRHVYVRIEAGRRMVDIETTSLRGFDLRHPPELLSPLRSLAESPEEGRGAGSLEGAPRVVVPAEIPRVVSLERAVAFVWHNTGLRRLDEGRGLEAALDFQEEARLQPDAASRSAALAALIARAFRMEYEAGRFEAAYRIAGIGLSLFPDTTSGRDRLLAAAAKRIGAACDGGSPAEAESILDGTAGSVRDASDRARLDRAACPSIAVAAVRTGDYALAGRMAARYSASEPDRVEAARLARWIASREREDLRSRERNACSSLTQESSAGLLLGELSLDRETLPAASGAPAPFLDSCAACPVSIQETSLRASD